jgi:hypothetical protein
MALSPNYIHDKYIDDTFRVHCSVNVVWNRTVSTAAVCGLDDRGAGLRVSVGARFFSFLSRPDR